MAVTGTNIFTVTRDEIIKASLRILQVIGVGETPINEDYTNCTQALNIMIKGWSSKEVPLWVLQNIEIPVAANISSYTLGPGAISPGIDMSRPLGVVHAFVRDSNGNDTPLYLLSRDEYDKLNDKDASGSINTFYYDRQEPSGVLYVYNTPTTTGDTIHLRIQRQFYDMTDGTDNFDFPEEFFQALKWGLAAELYLEYPVPESVIQIIETKAEYYRMQAFDNSVEDASVRFTVATS